ncbi:hypothetical protein [Cupriavidus metallidurans]|uniref:hypothetical protein n=1 Tax=Cupriavidus metallidurans TaxID=119219 RepID=UPI001319D727|nr:hypothetical protein [Cupriavidus metallidurans]
MQLNLVGAVIAAGIVFWLAGGTNWLAEKTRQIKLDNDLKEPRLKSEASEKH